MKHASEKTLERLETLLEAVRLHKELKEKKPGVFYWKSQAFLHFHEDGCLLFADLKVNSEWQRFSVNEQVEQDELVKQVAIVLG